MLLVPLIVQSVLGEIGPLGSLQLKRLPRLPSRMGAIQVEAPWTQQTDEVLTRSHLPLAVTRRRRAAVRSFVPKIISAGSIFPKMTSKGILGVLNLT